MPPDHQTLLPAALAALAALPLPDGAGLTAADACVGVAEGAVQFELGYAAASLGPALQAQIAAALAPHLDLPVQLHWRIAPRPSAGGEAIAGVGNIIAIASGKGGVGKSTTCCNLALALAAEGARVGVLDADIYGPSQDQMFGVSGQRPTMLEPALMAPLPGIGGVQVMGMGNLVTDRTPMVWRGPMASGALQQLLKQTRWDSLDYLLVDMPPGTGDIALTLSQSVPLAGAVVVTTPQSIALLDAQKGIEMFNKVSVPVLGIVENMAAHICSECGHADAIFGEGGGSDLAEDYAVTLLGQLPLARSIRLETDAGRAPVLTDPDGPIAASYRQIARRLSASLWRAAQTDAGGPTIGEADD